MYTDKVTSTNPIFKASRLNARHKETTRRMFALPPQPSANTHSEIGNFGTPNGTVWTQTHGGGGNANAFDLQKWEGGRVRRRVVATRDSAQIFGTNCVFGLYVWRTWTCMITIGVILMVYGLAGALSVSILLSVELILSRVLLCWSCKTGDTTTG